MGKFIWRLPDGGVAVTDIAKGLDPQWVLAKTMYEIVGRVDQTTPFDPAIHLITEPYLEVEDADLLYHLAGTGYPHHEACNHTDCPDRYFRDAVMWDETVPGRCCCDMPKARAIHMDRIRVVRNAELEKESGSKHRQPPEIEALFTPERQARLQTLRDIPQTFDLITPNDTPEELKGRWPLELERT